MKKKIIFYLAFCMAIALTGCFAGNTKNSESQTQTQPQSQSQPQINTSDNNSAEEPVQKDVFAMDTYMNLKAYGNNASDALDKAETEIKTLESLFSATDKNSEISKINNSKGKPVQVSDDTYNVIKTGIDYGNKTGVLDIAIYPVLREWGFTTGKYKIPSDKKIKSLLKNTDISDIKLTGNNTVTVKNNMEIDLGSVAKGYTGDKIKEILNNNDVNSAVISLGGNVVAIGNKPDGSEWKVGITDPFEPSTTMGTLSVADENVITSGNYERYFEKNGKRYCHIIDPATGKPAESRVVSATIIGKSGIMCDALSTSFFILGEKKAAEYWRNSKEDFDWIIIDEDGNVYISEGLDGNFESSWNDEVNVVEK